MNACLPCRGYGWIDSASRAMMDVLHRARFGWGQEVIKIMCGFRTLWRARGQV